MTDELELSADNDQEPEEVDSTPVPQTQEELEQIFDKRFELFMSQLSERVEQEHAPVAIAIVVDPKYPTTPMVFKTGHIYDQARLVASVLKALRQEMDKELTA